MLGSAADWGETIDMRAPVLERVAGSLAQSGWSDVVDSLKGAIDDRSHVIVLGVAAGVLVVIWANWRVARWLMSLSDKRPS